MSLLDTLYPKALGFPELMMPHSCSLPPSRNSQAIKIDPMAQSQGTTNNSSFRFSCSCFHGRIAHGLEKDLLSILEGRIGFKGTNLVIGCVAATISLVVVEYS